MAMSSCGCDFGISTGPGLMAASYLRLHQSGSKRWSRRSPDTLRILLMIYTHLEGDKPIQLDFVDKANEIEVSVEQLRAEVDWFIEQEFLALDGNVDGVARVWVNPSVAFFPGTDPRVAAARHRFPYFQPAKGGMSAEEPVVIHPYEPELWEGVYNVQRELFENPRVFSFCPGHAR
ncbi:Uncharacterised protein [Streptomyces griseus]|nr:hypothetical protein SAMN04490359_2435 [Streptomyces griseus]SQA27296.1 Uncharacterised protein [Streptomyces griseus]